MRLTLVSIIVAAIACGGKSGTSSTDANGSGDGGDHAPTTVTLTLTNHPNTPATFSFLVAYQDGSGPWTLAPAPTGDTYTFPINAPVYGVAWTCIPVAALGGAAVVQARSVDAAFFAVAERTTVTAAIPPRCSDANPATVALTGTVTNRNATGTTRVHFGGQVATVEVGSGNYRIETSPTTADLLVVHEALQAANGADVIVDSATVVRAVAVTAATTQNVDFSTAAATQTFPVTATTTNGRGITATTTFYSANGTSGDLVATTGAPYETNSLAAAQMLGSDIYDQVITVAGMGASETTTNATATPAAETYAPPAPLGGAIATVPTSMPYPEIMTTWAAYPSVIGYAWAAAQTPTPTQCGGAACSITWTVALSPGVIGSSPSFQMPDLSALTGWATGLQMITGVAVAGDVQALTSTAGATDFPALEPPAAGTQRVFVRSAFSVTP